MTGNGTIRRICMWYKSLVGAYNPKIVDLGTYQSYLIKVIAKDVPKILFSV